MVVEIIAIEQRGREIGGWTKARVADLTTVSTTPVCSHGNYEGHARVLDTFQAPEQRRERNVPENAA